MSDLSSISWNWCLFCQEETSEHLECPARSKKVNSGKGYVTLVDNLQQFKNSYTLGSNLHLTDITHETLINNNASWYKSCRITYSAGELQRILKRKRDSECTDSEAWHSDIGSQCRPTRSECKSMKVAIIDKFFCFFCDEKISPSDKYRRTAGTFDLNGKVRQCATELSESRLLTKLEAGDMVATDTENHANCLKSLYKVQQNSSITQY